ncbi:MAG: DUF4396 domain-containing protein [Chitinophagales bacterium]|nr:DUF4396 domain-containing protein [Chitinophagales bacterium]
MSTLTLPTTLHCGGCIASIQPYFDGEKSIKEWKVNLEAPVKTITVSGENISEKLVEELLHKAGYELLKTAPLDSSLPPIGSSLTTPKGFWSDADKWKRAAFNTFNCLIGCSIGDFGMLLYIQWKHPHISMAVQMGLAIVAGLCTSVMLETAILRIREKFDWNTAFTTALSMSFISMVTMEIAMNLTDFMVTGGKANFNAPGYWAAFALAAIAGFLTPLPYNYYKLKKYNKACH